MAETQALFEQMHRRFDPAAAGDLEAVFQYCIADGSVYFITIRAQQCALERGEHEDPDVTLTLGVDTLAEILSGELDGMQAFMDGRLQASGDMMLATRLTELFPLG